MPKPFIRSIAWTLIACFLLDPVSAAMSSSSIPPLQQNTSHSILKTQALAPALLASLYIGLGLYPDRPQPFVLTSNIVSITAASSPKRRRDAPMSPSAPEPSEEELAAYNRIAETLCDYLERNLINGGTVSLSGLAGMGKSTLTVILAQHLKNRQRMAHLHHMDKALLPIEVRRQFEWDAVQKGVAVTDDYKHEYDLDKVAEIFREIILGWHKGNIEVIDSEHALAFSLTPFLPGLHVAIHLEGDIERAKRLFELRSRARYPDDPEFIENRMKYYDLVTLPSQQAYAQAHANEFDIIVRLNGSPKEWTVEFKKLFGDALGIKPAGTQAMVGAAFAWLVSGHLFPELTAAFLPLSIAALGFLLLRSNRPALFPKVSNQTYRLLIAA